LNDSLVDETGQECFEDVMNDVINRKLGMEKIQEEEDDCFEEMMNNVGQMNFMPSEKDVTLKPNFSIKKQMSDDVNKSFIFKNKNG
jgi:hypothetical protein